MNKAHNDVYFFFKFTFLGKRLTINLVAQMVKNLSAMWGTRVQSLGREDPLEKGIATQPRILAWEIP